MKTRITPASASLQLAQQSGQEYVTLFQHGTLAVEYYQPRKVDRQTPHDRDEVYVVIAGSGRFFDGETTQPFGPGEVLFVAAGVEHRFEDFSDDFATWVLFYGPQGGEAAIS